MIHTVYIGLGSNLVEPIKQISGALAAIDALQTTQIQRCSSLYSSKPMGPQDQPDYVNAVVCIETSLTPHALLHALQHIELAHGRERKAERWGPRTLDLDILLFGQLVVDTKDLIIPHYGMKEREFVLYPLAEIAQDLVLPCGKTLESVLNTVARNGLQRMTLDVGF